jgi:hypothetical protein
VAQGKIVGDNFPALRFGMPHRRFKDKNDREWEVWDVRPASVEEMLRVHRSEPRLESQTGVALPAELREGWLAFHSDDEARRLAPIPLGWDSWSDSELEQLSADAHHIPKRRSKTEVPSPPIARGDDGRQFTQRLP